MKTAQEQLIESAKGCDDGYHIIAELHAELSNLHTHLDAVEFRVQQQMMFPESDEKDNGYETEEDQRKDTDAYAKGSFLLIVLFVVCAILVLTV